MKRQIFQLGKLADGARLGIMSAAMALIAERATEVGARHVLTFVDQHNIASLKGCQRAGFHPQRLAR
jgi:RimJ/RimL family protein N-acetyltransferase